MNATRAARPAAAPGLAREERSGEETSGASGAAPFKLRAARARERAGGGRGRASPKCTQGRGRGGNGAGRGGADDSTALPGGGAWRTDWTARSGGGGRRSRASHGDKHGSALRTRCGRPAPSPVPRYSPPPKPPATLPHPPRPP